MIVTSGLVISMGVVGDLLPLQKQLMQNQAVLVTLEEKAPVSYILLPPPAQKNKVGINDLLAAVQRQTLILRTLHFISGHDQHFKKHLLRIQLQGVIENIIPLLLALNDKHSPYWVVNYKMKHSNNDQFDVTMDVLKQNTGTLLNLQKTQSSRLFSFCTGVLSIPNNLSNARRLSARTPIALLRRVGIIRQGPRSEAFVKLPTDIMFAVQEGDLLGKENARVLRITQTHILLKLVNGNLKIL